MYLFINSMYTHTHTHTYTHTHTHAHTHAHTHTHTHTHTHSKNTCGYSGLAEVIKALSYSPSIEHLLLTDLSLSGGSVTSSNLPAALAKLFGLSVTLKQVNIIFARV